MFTYVLLSFWNARLFVLLTLYVIIVSAVHENASQCHCAYTCTRNEVNGGKMLNLKVVTSVSKF